MAAALALSAVLAEIALRLPPSGIVVEPNLYRMAEDGLLLLRPDWRDDPRLAGAVNVADGAVVHPALRT